MQKKLLFLSLCVGTSASLHCADDEVWKKINISAMQRRHSDPTMTNNDRELSPGRAGGAQRVRSYALPPMPATGPQPEGPTEDCGVTLVYFQAVLRDLGASQHIYLSKQIDLFAELKKNKKRLQDRKEKLNVKLYGIKRQEDGIRPELNELRTDIFSLIRSAQAQKTATDSLVTSCDLGSE